MAFTEQYPIKSADFTLQAPGDRAVLFIHGYTGSPMHFKEFAEFVNHKGFHCRVMRLPGHGSDAHDLAHTTYLDWREAVHEELEELSKTKSKVFLIGYSFGSNLALDAAMHYPDLVAGLVVIAAPVFVKHSLSLRLLLRFFDRYTSADVKRKPWVRKKKIDEYEASGTYAHIPIRATLEFFSFLDNFTKPHLKDIKTPCLILQAEDDPIVDSRSAEYIFDHVGSEDKKLVMLDGKEHRTISDDVRQLAYKETADFLTTH